MIDFKNKGDMGTLIFLCFSALLLVITLIAFWLPKPRVVGLTEKTRKATTISLVAAKIAKARTNEIKAAVDQKIWVGTVADIGPSALAKVNSLSEKHKLKLTAFRPQRITPAGDLSQVPFVITVEGTFLSVLAFEKDFEISSSRLALNSVQITSGEDSTDRVIATIGLLAYLREVAKPPKTTKLEVKHG